MSYVLNPVVAIPRPGRELALFSANVLLVSKGVDICWLTDLCLGWLSLASVSSYKAALRTGEGLGRKQVNHAVASLILTLDALCVLVQEPLFALGSNGLFVVLFVFGVYV
jgi:hypothetical protein